MKLLSTCIFLLYCSVFSLNPIHEASYQLRPSDIISTSGMVHTGLYISPESNQKVRIPFSYSKGFDFNLELGAGLKTRWLDETNNFRHLVFGAKYRIEDLFTVHTDLLYGVANRAGDGLTFTLNRRLDFSERFFSPVMARFGFFDALVWGPDGFMAIEAGYYPTLIITQSIFFELGVISSSQIGDFSDFFGLDLQPDLIIDLKYDSQLVLGAIFGLMGPRKASSRVQMLINYSL